MQTGNIGNTWTIQYKSLKLADAAYNTIDDKARKQLTQGTCHQEDVEMDVENLELNLVISIYYEPIFLKYILDGQYKCIELQFYLLVEVVNTAMK